MQRWVRRGYELQWVHCQRESGVASCIWMSAFRYYMERDKTSLPDRLMTVQVVCETPTEITKLSSVPFSILDWWIRETYSNIISPSLEVINGFNKGCRESRKPEKEGGDLGISFVLPEGEGQLTRTMKAARPSIMLEFRVRYAILFLSICEVMEMGYGGKRLKEKTRRRISQTFICTSDVRACYPRRHVIVDPRTVWKKIVKGGLLVTSTCWEGDETWGWGLVCASHWLPWGVVWLMTSYRGKDRSCAFHRFLSCWALRSISEG